MTTTNTVQNEHCASYRALVETNSEDRFIQLHTDRIFLAGGQLRLEYVRKFDRLFKGYERVRVSRTYIEIQVGKLFDKDEAVEAAVQALANLTAEPVVYSLNFRHYNLQTRTYGVDRSPSMTVQPDVDSQPADED